MSRGLKNLNPFNLRKSGIRWRGEIDSTDPDFEQFSTIYDGLRAGMKNVFNYHKLHGIQTVQEIIHRYAPSIENPTDKYVDFVCKRLAVGPDDKLNLCDGETLVNLSKAIILFENGSFPYDDDLIRTVAADVISGSGKTVT